MNFLRQQLPPSLLNQIQLGAKTCKARPISTRAYPFVAPMFRPHEAQTFNRSRCLAELAEPLHLITSYEAPRLLL